ncbi:MAG: O-methyltransferase [Thermomicrobiales bacterium]
MAADVRMRRARASAGAMIAPEGFILMQMLKTTARKILPQSVADELLARQEAMHLRKVATVSCDPSALLSGFGADDLAAVFRSPDLDREWVEVETRIRELGITANAGGVNPGDRRAVYYLVRHFQPASLLEVGTHIGASTVHLAAAMLDVAKQHATAPGTMTSVDIMDVNDPVRKPWLGFGAASSPRSLTDRLGAGESVTYVTQPSLEFIKTTPRRFDFCFLDGDHTAKTVYPELAATMRLLNPGGVILLHDYFPGKKPLWPEARLHSGPWAAVQRLQNEGAKFTVLPLGELPWPTKLSTNITSLALVVRS